MGLAATEPANTPQSTSSVTLCAQSSAAAAMCWKRQKHQIKNQENERSQWYNFQEKKCFFNI